MDWTDLESFSRPPPRGTSDCADPEASWGHRKNNLLRSQDELFYGYYLSAGIMMPEENGPAVPEFARRGPCLLPPRPGPRPRARADRAARRRDPARRHPRRLRLRAPRRRSLGSPLRAAGASLVQDLHPHDRGPKGTHQGAIISNGNLYCPCTPRTLLELGPLARAATKEQAAAPRRQDRRAGPPQARPHHPRRPRRLPPRRLPCRHGQDPLPAPPRLDDPGPGPARDPHPPEHPQACCTQQTITVPPDVNAKTRQKHDYPSTARRRSYARRTGAERGFATVKDPAANDISRGWCRLMGLTPLILFTATLVTARNQRILTAWNARPEETPARAAAGLPPRTRRRRRKTLAMLTGAPP